MKSPPSPRGRPTSSRALKPLGGLIAGQTVLIHAAAGGTCQAAVAMAGVLGPGRPTCYGLAEGPKALAELEARATVGKLTLLP